MMMSSARHDQHVQKAVRQAIARLQEVAEGFEHVVLIAEEVMEEEYL